LADSPPYRLTRQRALILQTLRETGSHLSADEIYLRVRKILPKISLGTVYRNLELLYEIKAINKLELGGGQNRWDGETGRHYHVRCAVCARVENVVYHPVEDMEAAVRKSTAFRVIDHHLEFVGMCPECTEHMVSPGLKRMDRTEKE